jgi:hypothetical protein
MTIKDNIRRILKEETSIQTKIKNKIDSFGIRNVIKLMGLNTIVKVLDLDLNDVDTQLMLVKNFIYHTKVRDIEVSFLEVKTAASGGKIIKIYFTTESNASNITSWYVNNLCDELDKLFPFRVKPSWTPVFGSGNSKVFLNSEVIKDDEESVLNENDELTNRILDKINQFGMESLSNAEKQYLDNKSQDVVDDELEDIVSIDSGYEFNDVIDEVDVKFIYEGTEEWDDDPLEYKHMGEFIYGDESFSATLYTDEDLNVHSFDIHDGEDYIQVNDELEDKVLEFFEKVGDKLKQNMI